MEFITCNKDCYQYKKGYCTIAKFGKICGKQTFKRKGKNNMSNKPIGRGKF